MPLSIMEEEEICIACQNCCRYLTFVVNKATYEIYADFYNVRGVRPLVFDGRVLERRDVVALRVPSDCSAISKSVGCAIYHKRPDWCRNYDGRIDPYFKDLCKLP